MRFSQLALGGCAAMLLAVSGCGESETTDNRDAAQSDNAADLARALAVQADYEPASGPSELAARSDLAVRGRIQAIVPGPSYGEEPEGVTTSAVVQVQVSEVLEGDLPKNSDGMVYLDLFGAGPSIAETFPKQEDQEVLLYLFLQPPPEETTPGTPVTSPDAGRPAGQPLFGTTTPQGFLVQTPSAVVQPQEDQKFEGATLEDFEPAEREFPTAASESASGL